MLLKEYEPLLRDYIAGEMDQDLAHDMNHVLRVVSTAKTLCDAEKANRSVVIPAAYLHDCFSFGKGHPQRSQSSQYAADKAITFLKTIDYPQDGLADIHHAIVAHSYSANVPPRTLEAKIVQDADRLDALGAMGIVRCIQVGSKLDRTFYSQIDPFCEDRDPDDAEFTLDHFYTKLLNLEGSMHTLSARAEARKRTEFMTQFLGQLSVELRR
ncbi:HD domain-containing protein [Marinomonas mediterranea]|uniref:HD domain-containing protein n=1 Tax=Marinomonas mediterranea TaxID=119864 RepID=UPI00234A7E52|nr:HD domain-containing protein [Marinomonas mediterranea]WCN12995.1 HD domain-containing protein [Marinomonas mediterranea]